MHKGILEWFSGFGAPAAKCPKTLGIGLYGFLVFPYAAPNLFPDLFSLHNVLNL